MKKIRPIDVLILIAVIALAVVTFRTEIKMPEAVEPTIESQAKTDTIYQVEVIRQAENKEYSIYPYSRKRIPESEWSKWERR